MRQKKEKTEKEGEKSTQIEHPKGSNDQKKKKGVPAYTPSVPFSQRLYKSRREEQFSKFLDIFNKIEINIPFAEVISQVPLYAKFLKEILSKKRKIVEEGIVNLTATCSAIIQQKLPAKMKDPGSFIIPCSIEKYEFKKALCDSGASINLMPLLVVQRLIWGNLPQQKLHCRWLIDQWHNQKAFLKMYLSRLGNSSSQWILLSCRWRKIPKFLCCWEDLS